MILDGLAAGTSRTPGSLGYPPLQSTHCRTRALQNRWCNRLGPWMAQILCNQQGGGASNQSMRTLESPILVSEPVPVSSIPPTTRLFGYFLQHFDRVKRFYAPP